MSNNSHIKLAGDLWRDIRKVATNKRLTDVLYYYYTASQDIGLATSMFNSIFEPDWVMTEQDMRDIARKSCMDKTVEEIAQIMPFPYADDTFWFQQQAGRPWPHDATYRAWLARCASLLIVETAEGEAARRVDTAAVGSSGN